MEGELKPEIEDIHRFISMFHKYLPDLEKVDTNLRFALPAAPTLRKIDEDALYESSNTMFVSAATLFKMLERMAREYMALKASITSAQPSDVVEALAKIEHEQWVHWAKSIATSEAISAERKQRWFECFKPYHELTEEQKEQDRVWARKALSTTQQAQSVPDKEQIIKHVSDYSLYTPEGIKCSKIAMAAIDWFHEYLSAPFTANKE